MNNIKAGNFLEVEWCGYKPRIKDVLSTYAYARIQPFIRINSRLSVNNKNAYILT